MIVALLDRLLGDVTDHCITVIDASCMDFWSEFGVSFYM